MEILGIGPLEFFFIVVLMLVVLGPKDMVKVGRQIGALIRRVIRSPMWQSMMSASQEIRDLPTKLVRESGLEEDIQELRKSTQQVSMDPLKLDLDLKSSPPVVESNERDRPADRLPSNQETIWPGPAETVPGDPVTNTQSPSATPPPNGKHPPSPVDPKPEKDADSSFDI